MPHIRSKKYSAVEEKLKLYDEFMKKMEKLTDIQQQVANEIQEIKEKYEKEIKEQDIIIAEEDEKEIANKANSPLREYSISATEEQKLKKKEQIEKQDWISQGWACCHECRPKKPDGFPDGEKIWSCALGLWVDWRSVLSPQYKTSMCNRGDDCVVKYGRCCFAHHEGELRKNYNFKKLIKIEDYQKHQVKTMTKLKTGEWDWEKELIHDRLIKE